MRAVARNIDFVSVSEKAPASAFAWVAVRVRIICCYASAIPQPICEALAELFGERRKGKEAQVSPIIQTLFGWRPTSFEEFARRNAAIFRGEQAVPKV